MFEHAVLKDPTCTLVLFRLSCAASFLMYDLNLEHQPEKSTVGSATFLSPIVAQCCLNVVTSARKKIDLLPPETMKGSPSSGFSPGFLMCTMLITFAHIHQKWLNRTLFSRPTGMPTFASFILADQCSYTAGRPINHVFRREPIFGRRTSPQASPLQSICEENLCQGFPRISGGEMTHYLSRKISHICN